MKQLILTLIAVFIGLALVVPDADARRLGGGRSSGMQRDMPAKREAAPQQAPNPAQNALNPAQPKRSWLGPLAGLAAGIGLAALFSHLGLGEEMANFLMIALLMLGGFLLVRWLASRNRPRPQAMQYAGAGHTPRPLQFEAPQHGGGQITGQATGQATGLPAGFDADAFARQAKVNFLRLQAAHDAGNLDDIREFTTPEMYAEIKLDIDERRGATQKTEVTLLEAEVLDAVEEGNRLIASVRFHGMLREDAPEASAFDETWHLVKPAQGKGGWMVAGIQQNG